MPPLSSIYAVKHYPTLGRGPRWQDISGKKRTALNKEKRTAEAVHEELESTSMYRLGEIANQTY